MQPAFPPQVRLRVPCFLLPLTYSVWVSLNALCTAPAHLHALCAACGTSIAGHTQGEGDMMAPSHVFKNALIE